MNRVDDVLIEHVWSPLAGWVRDRFGVDQWRASIEFLNGSMVFYIAGTAFEIAGKGPQDGIFVTMIRGLVWLLILDFARRRTYRQAASSVGIRTAREREWVFRMVFSAMLPVSLVYADGWNNFLYSASLLLLVCHLYFKASDTPPPEPRGKLAFHRG